MFYVYIIYISKLDKYYVGYTSNIELRIESYHNQGRSTYTSKGIPWVLKYVEEFQTELDAIRREKAIKNTVMKELLY